MDEAATFWLFQDLAKRTQGLDFLAEGCCVEAILALCKPQGDDCNRQHMGTLRALVASGIWTQDRVFRAGLVPDPAALCGERGTGALFHRCFVGPAHDRFRLQYFSDGSGDDFIGGALKNQHEPWAPYFTRGLFPAALVPRNVPPLAEEDSVEVKWHVNGSLQLFAGKNCCDGSWFHVKTPLVMRCGWERLGRGHLPWALAWACAGCPSG